MRAELETVLDLQPGWVASAPKDVPSEETQLQGYFIRDDIAGFVTDHVEVAARLL